MYVSCTKGQANDERSLICSRRPCLVSLQLSSCDIAVVLSSIQNLKDPDDTAPFSSLGPALLQIIFSYYGVFARKASHSQHHNHTTELSRSRGQHLCSTRPGGWTQINIKERNRVLLSGMCDTADFSCYLPVITANQILMLHTGNYRYREGSVCSSYPSPGFPCLALFVCSSRLSRVLPSPQLHNCMVA